MRTVIQQMFGKKLGPGALYGAINRLADKGWITPLPPSARRQPYESTESGRAYLRQSLAVIRRLAGSGLTEDKQVPSYYANVDDTTIEGELALEVETTSLRSFAPSLRTAWWAALEILTYLLERKDEGEQSIVSIVKASGDGGRDRLSAAAHVSVQPFTNSNDLALATRDEAVSGGTRPAGCALVLKTAD